MNESGSSIAEKAQESAPRMPIGESGLMWLPLTAFMIAADQLSKAWIVHHFQPFERHPLLPVLDLSLWFNTGAAWSFLAGASGWQRWMFVGLAIFVAVGLLTWMRRLQARAQWLLCISLALILSGALGNVTDRIRLGHVVDFVLVHWRNSFFPAFNVADAAISVGAVLLLWDAWREHRRGKRMDA